MDGRSPRKRSAPVEFQDFSDIKEPTPTAVVHGVVTAFSPMKKESKKQCFDGCMSDGKKKDLLASGMTNKISDLCKRGKPRFVQLFGENC